MDKTTYAKIVPGSKAAFTIYLLDEKDRPVSLAPYDSGKLVFCNTLGVTTEITLAVPGSNPDKGEIIVELTPAQTTNADKKWLNADIVLMDGADPVIVPISNFCEIIPRNCPPIVP